MTISDQETVDLGALAVAVETFTTDSGELGADVAPFASDMVDVAAASAWTIDAGGQRILVCIAAGSGLDGPEGSLTEHLSAQFAAPAVADHGSSWPAEPGESVVAVRSGETVVALLRCAATGDGPGVETAEDSGGLVSLGMLRDVPLEVTAELGRTQLSVAEILQLTTGSIVELDRPVGSPVDVVVNGSIIGRGEVVVIDDEYGVRITEILARMEDSI